MSLLQRQALLDAAKLAGLNVLGLIHSHAGAGGRVAVEGGDDAAAAWGMAAPLQLVYVLMESEQLKAGPCLLRHASLPRCAP